MGWDGQELDQSGPKWIEVDFMDEKDLNGLKWSEMDRMDPKDWIDRSRQSGLSGPNRPKWTKVDRIDQNGPNGPEFIKVDWMDQNGSKCNTNLLRV